MPRHQKVAGYYVIPSEILSVRPSVCLSVCLSVRPSAPTTILVSATPPTVLGQSFWNFTGVLRMVWRYAYCFFQNPEIIFYHFFPIFNLGERGGSVVECRTPEREVRGSRPTAAVLCPWARHFTPRKYWLITQEAMAPSRYDWKIVDWDVKPQHNQQPTNPFLT